MSDIDKNPTFHPLNIAVLTISDTRILETDTSGALLAERLQAAGHDLVDRQIVRDDISTIRNQVKLWAEDEGVDVILSTGGTAKALREAGLTVVDVSGYTQSPEIMDGISTLQSRALAGQVGNSFIFCLPGSPGACRDGWDMVLAQELDSRHRPCSLAGVIPRLMHICA